MADGSYDPQTLMALLARLPRVQDPTAQDLASMIPTDLSQWGNQGDASTYAAGYGGSPSMPPQANAQPQSSLAPQAPTTPLVDLSSLPQQAPPAQPRMATTVRDPSNDSPSVLSKLLNVVELPLNILNGISTSYASIPRSISQGATLRDQAIQSGDIRNRSAQTYANAVGSIIGSLGDGDGGGAAPSPATAPLVSPSRLPQLPPMQAAASPQQIDPSSLPQLPQASAPRGIRNNNPGNVRSLGNGQTWQGQTGVDDQGYAQFDQMQDGIRASLVNLHNYGALHGINTVQGVIQRWAPGAPPAYAQSVAQVAGVSPTDRIDLNNPDTLSNVAKGIFAFENGGWGQGGGTPQSAQGIGAASGSPAGPQAPQSGPLVDPSQLPQVGGGGTAATGLSPRAQRGLAALAIYAGNPDQAAQIMAGDVVPDSSGNLVDHKTGRVLGRVPTYSYVNGYRVDAGDPNAPSYIPKLADGTIPDGRGGVIAIPGASAAARQLSYADTAGKNDANWPGDVVQVTGPDGRPYSMSRTQFAQMTGAQGGQGAPAGRAAPAAGGSLPGFGGPTPAGDAFAKEQATDASKALSADMDARGQALQDLDNSRRALAYVQAHGNGLNPTTPIAKAGADYLRSLPPDTLKSVGVDPQRVDRFANDAGVYQQLSAHDLLSFAKSSLPARYTERELSIAGKVIPNLATAPDAASFHWGLQAAMANKVLQRADFSANYQGAPSRQAVEQAWNSTPAGQASLFEDPVWQGVKIGGKPAVVYVNKGGRWIGVVGMGTSSPTTFYASGAH